MLKSRFKPISIKLAGIFCAAALIVSTALLAGCGGETATSGSGSEQQSGQQETEAVKLLSGKKTAVIDVKDYGKITVELDADTAPITVTNFVKLADSGFYDGLTFHRIIKGFMIQGGDPLGTGAGGSDEEIKGEFSANGVVNNIHHARGVISMARSQLYNSASSQFFIVHEDSPHLDGQYAAFGHVTDGIEIVDQICEDVPVIDGNGTVAEGKKPIINSIKITD